MIEPRDKLSLLVVDDDEGMAGTLSDVLAASGYEVAVVHSGNQAIERVKALKPDGILMDIRMPGLNGVETFREIKRSSPESFVIFMTAYAASDLVEEARREGAVEVVPKPLDLERVLHLVERSARKTPVLVVDDDPTFCRSLTEVLALKDFDVHAAETVDDALRMFGKEPGRVVVLDMHMPGDSGLDALLLMKEINPRAVVILMTGYPDLEGSMRQGVSMSASACLVKPFDPEELIREIRRAVVRRRASREPSG